MKQFYDKILFAVAFILLLASLAIVFLGSKSEPDANISSRAPSGMAYEEILVPAPAAVGDTEWPGVLPVDGNLNRVYEVFTPPKIYWDPNKGELSWQAPVPPPPPPKPIKFGVSLAGIERELFRIQFEAYFEATDGTFENATVQFYNYHRNESIRGKVGDTFKDHGFKILSFKVERVVKEDPETGSTVVYQYPTVRIEDAESGSEITLTTAERLYVPDQFEIKMRASDPYPRELFVWEAAGETKMLGKDKFTLLDFNFDNQTVNVEKTAFTDEEGVEPVVTTKLLNRTIDTSNPENLENINEKTSEGDTELPEGLQNIFN